MSKEEDDAITDIFVQVSLSILQTEARGQLHLKCQKEGDGSWMSREERGDLPELTESQFFHIHNQTEAIIRGAVRSQKLLQMRIAAEFKKNEG